MRVSLPLVSARAAVPMALPVRPQAFGRDGLPPLRDGRDRNYSYLRLSLTDRCNLACVYCMPPGGELEHSTRPSLLSADEIVRLIAVTAQMGVRRVRFTGGEPLVRKDVVGLIDRVSRTGVDEIVMTTNGTRLAELAGPLASAGLRGVNVSIDTLDADRFREVTRGGEIGPVLAGLQAAIDAGLEVKLNAVVLGGINEDDAGALVDFAWSLGVVPRFIELMPLGEASQLPQERFLSATRVAELLGDRLDRASASASELGRGPARYLPASDGSARKVGFITAMSDEFCASCNRIRITAQGDVRACLADRRATSVRDVMRAGGDDLDLAWAIHWALGAKDLGHHFLERSAQEHTHVGMSLIGG